IVSPLRWLGLTASFQGSTDLAGTGARPVEIKQLGRDQESAASTPGIEDQVVVSGSEQAGTTDRSPLWPWTPDTERRRGGRAPATDRRRKPRRAKAHLFVTVCHWSMVGLLALSLLTGMRIGWGYLESPLGGPTGAWGRILGSIAPAGTLLGINVI